MAARRAAIDRIALGSHADNADHRPQRNAQALVPNKLIAVDFTHLSAPSIETITANALVFARAGNRLVVELDGIDALVDFANKLEKATIATIESGKMTKDLALITTLENPTVLNSENFIKAIRETLEGML